MGAPNKSEPDAGPDPAPAPSNGPVRDDEGTASQSGSPGEVSPFNIANVLSCVRILIVPILVVVLLTKFEGKEFVGLGLFLLAAVTDVLDGYLARRFGLVTRLGKLLDPAADKILVSAAFISLVELGKAPAWIVVTIVAREFAVTTLRSVAAADRKVIGSSWSGKLKTVVQVIAISLLIFDRRLGDLRWLADASLLIALVVTVSSGIEYGIRHARVVFSR